MFVIFLSVSFFPFFACSFFLCICFLCFCLFLNCFSLLFLLFFFFFFFLSVFSFFFLFLLFLFIFIYCFSFSFFFVSFVFSCWVVLLGLLLPWRCFPLLLRGAAWFLPSLGGLSCLVVLPSFSSFGWGYFIPRLLLGGVSWFPPSFLGGVTCEAMTVTHVGTLHDDPGKVNGNRLHCCDAWAMTSLEHCRRPRLRA